MFGAGSPVAADGKTAQIPDYVANGEKWFNDGDLEGSLHPDTRTRSPAPCSTRAASSPSGNLAMNEGHTWFTCCVTPTAPAKPFNFGFAVAAGLQRGVTAPLHVDTFSILKTTKVPDEAFKALTAMVASPELLTDLRRHAGRPGQAAGAGSTSIDKNFPGIKLDWSIAAGHARLPGHPQQPVVRARTTLRPRPPSRPSRTRSGPPPGSTWTPSWRR